MVFQFKQFKVTHSQSSIKIGTDAVLLGAWAEVNAANTILDVGTGCGIIALMMAQKNKSAIIKAIDIHQESIIEATENFVQSPWETQLSAELISLQDFNAKGSNPFDHIISNPPFFSQSMPSPNLKRHNARHTSTLSQEDFFCGCKRLLTSDGKLSIIIPYQNSEKWIETAYEHQLFPSRITNVFPHPQSPLERVLIEFINTKGVPLFQELSIRRGKGQPYSEKYVALTGEFYL